MSQISTLINCPQLQSQINNTFGADPTKYNEGVPFTQFVLSDFNTSNTEQKLSSRTAPGGGKRREVELVYSPRLSESGVSNSTGREDCTSTNQVGELSELYTIGDTYIQEDILIDPMHLIDKCQDNASYFADKMMQLIDVMDRTLETKLVNSLALLNGTFAVGEPDVTVKTKTVKTARASAQGSGLDTNAWVQTVQATRYAGYPTAPIVFASRAYEEYARSIQAGCCYADWGYDVSKLAADYGQAVLGGYRFDNAFGTNQYMTAAAGALQLLEWQEYEGPRGINVVDTEVYKQTVLISPRTGAKYDIKMNMDCNGKISIFARKYYKLVTMPTDVFLLDDRLSGVNRVNLFKITNPA